MEWLINALLKISKIDTGTAVFQKEKVNLLAMLKTSLEPLEIPMELRNISHKLNCSPGFSFQGDQNWTIEAIGNILKNSIEHTPENGTIEITCTENAIFTEIIIQDNGSGIDSEDLPHIFQRFYQGKHQKEGSYGIGLALSRMILSQENATIKAENHPAGGTKFTIRFYKANV
jgi:signal transduction histidine kinase